jgi:hypothetical protein
MELGLSLRRATRFWLSWLAIILRFIASEGNHVFVKLIQAAVVSVLPFLDYLTVNDIDT